MIPKITVAIISYNYGDYVQHAIESCLWQQEPTVHYEVLVIDDGSTDDTARVVSRYIQDKKIRYSRSENLGFGASLGRAISESSGEWVMLLDADDWFAPNKLFEVSSHLCSDLHYIANANVFTDSNGGLSGHVGSPGNTSTLTVRRSSSLDILPVEDESGFDLLRIAGLGKTITAPLTYHRIHCESLSSDESKSFGRRASRYQKMFLKVKDWKGNCPSWLTETARRQAEKQYWRMTNFSSIEHSIRNRQRAQAVLKALKFLASPDLSLANLRLLMRAILLRPVPSRQSIYLRNGNTVE
jgi:glycosyltransferase involved in cell wall biosynthesis